MQQQVISAAPANLATLVSLYHAANCNDAALHNYINSPAALARDCYVLGILDPLPLTTTGLAQGEQIFKEGYSLGSGECYFSTTRKQ